MHLYIESLGCARNQVDSESMAGQLIQAGWSVTRDPAQAAVIVVNTCSFVESAINESIDTILELAKFKQSGQCRRLVVAGCLPERFREAIAEALPEVDRFLGTGAFSAIVDAVAGDMGGEKCLLPDPDRILSGPAAPRQRTLTHSAYLKIAEGCSRHCTYCIIPRLRGRQKSRPLDRIVSEAQELITGGVKELNLVAQDTTQFGRDLPEPVDLSTLLTRLAALDEGIWIRFLYGHPQSIDDTLIDTVAAHPNLCAYFDLPIQHAAATVLEKMGRRYTKKHLLDLFGHIRERIPDAAIRTTLIVGFPGETESDFEELIEFVERVRFDHLGVFTYSDAEDLPSHGLPDHVSPAVARSRYDAIMARQLEISTENLAARVGTILPVMIDAAPEPDRYEGRSMLQAPEVDGITLVSAGPQAPALSIGQIVPVRVTDSLEYDLMGTLL